MTRSSAGAAANGNLEAARRLYDAFGAHDARALLASLTEDFRGVVCDGMPDGLGGTYDGAQTMLRECWRRVFALVDVRAVPAEYLPIADDPRDRPRPVRRDGSCHRHVALGRFRPYLVVHRRPGQRTRSNHRHRPLARCAKTGCPSDRRQPLETTIPRQIRSLKAPAERHLMALCWIHERGELSASALLVRDTSASVGLRHTRSANTRAETRIPVGTQLHRRSPRDAVCAESSNDGLAAMRPPRGCLRTTGARR